MNWIVSLVPAVASAVLQGAVPASAASNWSGLYGGLDAGWVWGNVSVQDDANDQGIDPGPFGYSASGAFGGLTGGYNWQSGNVVFGLEGELGYMNLSGAGITPSQHSGQHQDVTLRGGVYGDLTARAGYAFGDTLLYGKGGFAFFAGQAKQATTDPGYATTGTGAFTGWIAGVGVEHYITPMMSVGLEYQHRELGPAVGLQTALYDDPPTVAGYQFHNWTTVVSNSIKIGVNWHFGDPAP